jgi:hypothetical protein
MAAYEMLRCMPGMTSIKVNVWCVFPYLDLERGRTRPRPFVTCTPHRRGEGPLTPIPRAIAACAFVLFEARLILCNRSDCAPTGTEGSD